ncbi:MAG: hypothetical protein GY708_24555, partial [Actinomycetia bacterium]|nr:hypothetical protein [Actinomycetes bacterium]
MTSTKKLAVFAILAVLATVPAAAQGPIGPGPFAFFPTEDVTDARMLAFGCGGLSTLEQAVSFSVAVPATETEFT